MPKTKIVLPADWLAGLKENFKTDAVSGFIVFLLALPLSLGIAKASNFPPIMGLITAIIGGLFVSFIMGSRLTIKGPAAGLIVIVAAAVEEFGKGDLVLGWHLALGSMFVAGLVQVLFGIMKFGKLVDFFPLSAVKGMLAAIGVIIITKQIPVLLNSNPETVKGLGAWELLSNLPTYFSAFDNQIVALGFVCLLIMLGWPLLKNKVLKLIPAPLLVMLLVIPLSYFLNFKQVFPDYTLVQIGDFTKSIKINVDFLGFFQPGIFVKYVTMFALVGSLESLLTVKAIDLIDPYKRKSNTNKDLIAVGLGNTLAAFLGGLPMISEVARSSSNVNNGAKTRWANFFHGFFILVFVWFASPLIEMIPNTALAAMLIAVGLRLCHPNEFVKVYKIGVDQLAIFIITIFFTLYEDLLIGIAAGIVLKILILFGKGVAFSSFYILDKEITQNGTVYRIQINKGAIFTNIIKMKKSLDEIPLGLQVVIDLKNVKIKDYSFVQTLKSFSNDYELENNGSVTITGL